MRNPIDAQEPVTTVPPTTSNASQTFHYVNIDLIEDDLICPICQLPFVDPVVHRCENTFCSKCIETLTTCPFCREEGDLKKECCAAHKIVRNQLDKLKVHCNMCKNVVNRGELKDHQEKYCMLLEAYVEVEKKKQELDRMYQSNVEELKKQNEIFLLEEKEKLKQERVKMVQEIHQENENNFALIRSQNEALEKERQLFQQEKASRYRLEFSNKPIHLNVGGNVMTVALSYFIGNKIEPNNLFKNMFNGEHPLYDTPTPNFQDKVFFIDCHPEVCCVGSELEVPCLVTR